jgi:SNF family Na+-dependent transporter
VTLAGLTSSATNEFCEVILGGSIVIPAAFVFFGAAGAFEIAKSGTFNIGFVTMPLIFDKLPVGNLISALWFILLFLAGITSSVSLIQPAIAFLEDEFKCSRRASTLVLGAITFLACQPVIFFLSHGFLDELDFWGGTFFLVVFATIETLLFVFLFGMEKGWDEMHVGAKLRIPRFYKFIIKFVTPAYLLILLGVWTYQQFIATILMKGVADADKPYVWGARALVFGLLGVVLVLIAIAWRRRAKEETP